jgi:hypothetical protein
MKEDKNKPGRHQAATADRVEPDDEPSPEVEAKAANQLPVAEQLSAFEKNLEHDDGGNQPS